MVCCFRRHVSSLQVKIEPVILFLPLLLIDNYLVMALGLALNTASAGASDELQNRPVVWAYLGVVSWTAGAAYAWGFGNHPPQGRATRVCVVALYGRTR